MDAITRQPRLLVKIRAVPPQASLSFRNKSRAVRFEPLFTSVRPSSRQGLAAEAVWHVMTSDAPGDELNAWDLCHHVLREGLGIAGVDTPQFAEPDLEQRWTFGSPAEHTLALTRSCERPEEPDARLPSGGSGPYWFRDSDHSQLEKARGSVDEPSPEDTVRIAHFDTGYDPEHRTRPAHLRLDLQKNFVDDDRPNDATDTTSGFLTNLGHGTGTLGILAGAEVDGAPLGGAPFLDVVPVRVASAVVLFKNSAIARAFDYVHGLWSSPGTRVHVITMSMGGLASLAWADAVNALYDLGVFIVTAAGNNFGNLPTRNIVYPARFNRVIAACGVMADGRPYADLPLPIMAGNYGPPRKMGTALAAFTPNAPWARLGCQAIVDRDGQGTSAATPQIAAAAALWIQQFKKAWESYPAGWMRVEAVRKALDDAARLDRAELRERLGRGVLRANDTLHQRPAAESALEKQPEDSASFPFLRVITGLGLAAVPDARQRMLELEVLHLTQKSRELEALCPDPEGGPDQVSILDRQRFLEALIEAPGASATLRESLGAHVRGRVVPPTGRTLTPGVLAPEQLKQALSPALPAVVARRLRVFAFDPLLGTRLDTLGINQTTLEVRWEKDLGPGPVGEYLEVVDIDPATGAGYAPVDLNHAALLSQHGLPPSEANPQFHQQMVYAVAMKTIEHFERALGRVALWAPRRVRNGDAYEERHVRRLRLYPHALREANAFYSPDKKALLFGYFPASESSPGENLPGGTVFCALSHDIVAHETTHALLDGLHRRYRELTNPDMLAFHEAFADIVALFQHFTVPEALRDQIARTRGDLGQQNLLGELAQQFGEAIGNYGALRSAIGSTGPDKRWQPAKPSRTDYEQATEAHDRGAVLVAAVFDAFLAIYRTRSEDLVRLATGGTGVLPPGAISHELVNRLAQEASRTAEHILNICIRALDYCPPVDLTFGDYLRALITADHDLVPDDPLGYRVAFIQAFRRRGIYPKNVRNLSTDSLVWERPDIQLPINELLGSGARPENRLSLGWHLHAGRRKAFNTSRSNARIFHEWIRSSTTITDADARALGFDRREGQTLQVNGRSGKLSKFEVHSVRPVRRVGPDGQQLLDVVVEITQSWKPLEGRETRFRGGCTLLVDVERREIRYCVRKRVGLAERIDAEVAYRAAMVGSLLRGNYFDDVATAGEPFAMLHRGV